VNDVEGSFICSSSNSCSGDTASDSVASVSLTGLQKAEQLVRERRMFYVCRDQFHAAHHIAGHPKCGKTHGHTYRVEVIVPAERCFDFAEIKVALKQVLMLFDHKDLGDCTCEEIAAEIFRTMQYHIPVVRVTVWETESCGVIDCGPVRI